MKVSEAIRLLKKLSPYDDVNLVFSKPALLRSGDVEKLGISRQLLRYHVNHGHVRTVFVGKQKRYYLEDIESII